jgi:hypothetical protein
MNRIIPLAVAALPLFVFNLPRSIPFVSITVFTVGGLLMPQTGFAQTPTKVAKIEPSQLLGKTVEECEALLGEAVYVEGMGLGKKKGRMQRHRHYKLPNGQPVVVVWNWDESAGFSPPVILPDSREAEYVIPKSKAKTWQDAFKIAGINPAGYKLNKDVKGEGYSLKKPSGQYSGFWVPAGFEAYGVSDKRNHQLSVRLARPAKAKEATSPGGSGSTPGTAAISTVLDLSTTLGRDFVAYKQYLGLPATVSKDKVKGRDGESRVYSNATLLKKGIAKVYLGAYPLKGNPQAVTSIRIVFANDLTWQQALESLGVNTSGITPIEEQNTMMDVRTNTSASFTSLNFGGVSVAGVPMAGAEKDRAGSDTLWGEGFAVSWAANDPSSDNKPTVQIEYRPYTAVNTEPWSSVAFEGAAGSSVTMPDGSIEITTTKVGQNPWSHQGTLTSKEIVDGKRYLVSFEARSDAPRRIGVSAEMAEAPYSPIGLNKPRVELGTDYKTYSFVFTAKGATGKRVKVPALFFGTERAPCICATCA